MKCSLVISNFLEEISSPSHSVVFLYFFALITEEGFLIFPCYSLEFCRNVFLIVLEGEEPEIKMPIDSASTKGLLPGS